MTTAFALVCAMLIDAALGEPRWLWSRLPHPAVLMGRLIGFLDTTFNKGAARRAKGVACVTTIVLLAVGIGYCLALLGPVVEICIAAILLAQRSLVDHVAAVATGLRGSLIEGRAAVSMIVSRDTSDMDETEVARAAIESAAENLSDGVIAPAFWFLMAGLPGIIAYKMINTADSMIGYRTPKHAEFGWSAARLDDLVNLIPARLTALLIAVVTGTFDLRGIIADARLHRSPNAGWPEAAISRAQDIALSGPRSYEGERREFDWVNTNGRRTLTPEDIDATITILWKVWGAAVTCCAVLAFALF